MMLWFVIFRCTWLVRIFRALSLFWFFRVSRFFWALWIFWIFRIFWIRRIGWVLWVSGVRWVFWVSGVRWILSNWLDGIRQFNLDSIIRTNFHSLLTELRSTPLDTINLRKLNFIQSHFTTSRQLMRIHSLPVTTNSQSIGDRFTISILVSVLNSEL